MHRVKFAVLAVFVCFALAVVLSRSGVTHVFGERLSPAIAAPTGVTASDSEYVTKVGVRWDTIRDATLYRIFRNTVNNSATATDIGTTPANYFFDPTAAAAQTYFYWVRAESGAVLSLLGTPDQGTRASGTVIPGPFEPLEPPTAPVDNAVTASKAYLGKALFWDEQMSSTKTVSCGTCHRPSAGGSDPRTVIGNARSQNPGYDNVFNTADDVFGSPGVPQNNPNGAYTRNPIFGFSEQVTGRKSPSYLNAGYSRTGLFWDGRAEDTYRDQLTNSILLIGYAALESQSAGPPVSAGEMGHTGRDWTQVAARIQASRPLALASNIPVGLKTWIGTRTYPELFQEVFGTPDVTPARISMAIATHERTLFSDNTPLDRAASQIVPLTPQEESGRQLFDTLSCSACHGGSLMTDNGFHNIGVRPQIEDKGRGAITNSGDDGRFRTPTLRNIELRGPYMHNGRFGTLEEVIDFYDRGGDFDANNIDHDLIRPLNMTPDEKAGLLAFLKRPLTDLRVKNELPPFDRPQLYTESNRVPVVSGSGRAGLAMTVPVAIALEPPLLGNPNFNIAVTSNLRSGSAILVIDEVDPGLSTSIPSSGSFTRMAVRLSDAGPGNGGYASVNLAIPSDAALVGKTLYARWYIQDPRSRSRLGISRRVTFTIFRGATDIFAPFAQSSNLSLVSAP